MAYAVATKQVVLSGGSDGSRYLGDTWTWNGATSTWTQATPAHSPTAVTGPMVFAVPNGRVGEFGGFDGHLYQGTMWEWTGADWNQLQLPMVPYARSSAGVGFNPLLNQVVMFGGLADVNPVNTWTYDGKTWILQAVSKQPAWVYSSSAAFDSRMKSVVLFGGGSGGVDRDTTWSWNGSRWRQLFPLQSPPAREGAGMAYDAALGHIVLFGGQDGNVLRNDTWQLRP